MILLLSYSLGTLQPVEFRLLLFLQLLQDHILLVPALAEQPQSLPHR
jgi:hypothetical protein